MPLQPTNDREKANCLAMLQVLPDSTMGATKLGTGGEQDVRQMMPRASKAGAVVCFDRTAAAAAGAVPPAAAEIGRGTHL